MGSMSNKRIDHLASIIVKFFFLYYKMKIEDANDSSRNGNGFG